MEAKVINLADWKKKKGIRYKGTFYKELAKVILFPTNLDKLKVPAKKAA